MRVLPQRQRRARAPLDGQLNEARHKGVLRRAVDEGDALQHRRGGVQAGRRDLSLAARDSGQEVVRGVVQAPADLPRARIPVGADLLSLLVRACLLSAPRRAATASQNSACTGREATCCASTPLSVLSSRAPGCSARCWPSRARPHARRPCAPGTRGCPRAGGPAAPAAPSARAPRQQVRTRFTTGASASPLRGSCSGAASSILRSAQARPPKHSPDAF